MITMKTLIGYLCVVFLIAPIGLGQSGSSLVNPSLSRIALHPEQYLGKTVVFRGAWINGGEFKREVDPTNDRDMILFGVKTELDGYTPNILSSDGVTFVAYDRLGDRLVGAVRNSELKYQGDITGTVETVKDRTFPNRLYVIIRISKVKFGLLNTIEEKK